MADDLKYSGVDRIYIETTPKGTSKKTLIATGLMRCYCNDCKAFFYIDRNPGRAYCPFCRMEAIAEWGNLQISFVPEE